MLEQSTADKVYVRVGKMIIQIESYITLLVQFLMWGHHQVIKPHLGTGVGSALTNY